MSRPNIKSAVSMKGTGFPCMLYSMALPRAKLGVSPFHLQEEPAQVTGRRNS